jgi:hypothetical protein
VNIWQWPGSGNPQWTIDGINTDSLDVAYAYMDAEGREWAHVTIRGGWHPGGLSGPEDAGGARGWVLMCNSDGDIPAFNPAPEPIYWHPGETPDWRGDSHRSPLPVPDDPTQTDSVVLIITASAVVFIAGTVILIMVFRKSKLERTKDK